MDDNQYEQTRHGEDQSNGQQQEQQQQQQQLQQHQVRAATNSMFPPPTGSSDTPALNPSPSSYPYPGDPPSYVSYPPPYAQSPQGMSYPPQPYCTPGTAPPYPQPGCVYPQPPGYYYPTLPGQQQVVVVNGQPAAPVFVAQPRPISMTGAIVLSCIVYWLGGILFGGIAFILAMVGQSSAAAGDRQGALRMRNASYGLSVTCILLGVIAIAIIGGILGSRRSYYNSYGYNGYNNKCYGYYSYQYYC